jgi:hypothetical protein
MGMTPEQAWLSASQQIAAECERSRIYWRGHDAEKAATWQAARDVALGVGHRPAVNA